MPHQRWKEMVHQVLYHNPPVTTASQHVWVILTMTDVAVPHPGHRSFLIFSCYLLSDHQCSSVLNSGFPLKMIPVNLALALLDRDLLSFGGTTVSLEPQIGFVTCSVGRVSRSSCHGYLDHHLDKISAFPSHSMQLQVWSRVLLAPFFF